MPDYVINAGGKEITVTADRMPTDDEMEEILSGQAHGDPSLGDRLLKAVVPGVDEPLPDTVSSPKMSYNPLFGQAPDASGKQAPPIQLNDAGRAAVGVGRVVTGALGAPQRAVGAAFPGISGTPGDGFLDRMSQPDASLLRRAKMAVASSSQPAAAKVLESMGLGVVDDPLTYLGGFLTKAGRQGGVGAAMASNAAAKAEMGAPIAVSQDIKNAAAMQGGRAGTNSGVVSGIPFSRHQESILSGVPQDLNTDALAAKEAALRQNHQDVWDKMTQGQEQAVMGKAAEIQKSRGFNQASFAENSKDIFRRIMDAYEYRKGAIKANYNKIEAVGNSVPVGNSDHVSAALKAMDDHGFYPTRLVEHPEDAGKLQSVPVFEKKTLTPGTFTTTSHAPQMETYNIKGVEQPIVQDGERVLGKTKVGEDAAGREIYEYQVERQATDEAGNPAMSKTQNHYPSIKERSQPTSLNNDPTSGHSDEFAQRVAAARRLLYENPSYSNWKNARGMIGEVLGDAKAHRGNWSYRDVGSAGELYGKMTDVLGEHVGKSWGAQGADAVNDWKVQDAMYSKKSDFDRLIRVMRPTKEGVVEPEAAISKLIDSNQGENYQALMSVKDLEQSGALPKGTFGNLQNAVFNKFVQRATRTVNGRQVLDGDMLLKQANEIPTAFYNTIFSNGLEDDMSQLILESVAQKSAAHLRAVGSRPGVAASILKNAGGRSGLWAWAIGGKKAYMGQQLGRVLGGLVGRTSARSATDYIRRVDQKSLIGAFFKQSAGTAATGISAPQALNTLQAGNAEPEAQ